MAFSHGKNTYFAFGSAATPGTPDDISQYLNEVSFPETAETAGTANFGSGSHTYVIGLVDSTLSLSGMYDPAVDDRFGNVLGLETAIAFDYGPAGNGSGKPKYTGNAYVTSYEVSGGIGDMVSFSVELQVTGAVTRGTYV